MSRIYYTLLWTSLGFVIAILHYVHGQSVAEQCLTVQLQNNFNNLGQLTPEAVTLNAFRAICRSFDNYVRCFERRLNTSTDPADFFLSLIFDGDHMRDAYNRLCERIDEIEARVDCVLNTPEVQECFEDFNQAVDRLSILQRQRVRINDLREIACNVSLDRYRCETNIYSSCDEVAGEIMRDFYLRGLASFCQDIAGFNAANTVNQFITSFFLSVVAYLVVRSFSEG